MTNFTAPAVGLTEYKNRPETYNKRVIFDQNNLIVGNYENVDFPVIFRQSMGKKLCDLLDTEWVSFNLISDRFVKLLEENECTGWKTYPVRVFDKKGIEIFGYQGLSIIGRSGQIDYNKSTIIEKQLVLGGPLVKRYKGKYFDIDTWDKNDFFVPRGTKMVIITEKVAKLIKKNKLTNVYLKNLVDVETSI